MSEPIKLNFSQIRELIAQGMLPNKQLAYVGPDFAVLRSMRQGDNKFMQMGQPYRLVEPRIARVLAGKAQFTLNLIDYTIGQGDIIFMSRNTIVQPNDFTSDFNIQAVGADEDFLNQAYNGQLPQMFTGDTYDRIIHTSEGESRMMQMLYDAVWESVSLPNSPKDVAGHLIASIFGMFNHISQRSENSHPESTSHEREVFKQFIALVHKYSRQERNLNFYADQMCLSARYLGTLIHTASGDTAKTWIERSVIMEAKVMLRHSNMLTYEVAEALNFPNTAFFCKFFKRLTGQTPKEYCKK
jgi:AraC family transcriptional regulator, transcriptional activator of pobA